MQNTFWVQLVVTIKTGDAQAAGDYYYYLILSARHWKGYTEGVSLYNVLT